jgi:hypothetical protein
MNMQNLNGKRVVSPATGAGRNAVHLRCKPGHAAIAALLCESKTRLCRRVSQADSDILPLDL